MHAAYSLRWHIAYAQEFVSSFQISIENASNWRAPAMTTHKTQTFHKTPSSSLARVNLNHTHTNKLRNMLNFVADTHTRHENPAAIWLWSVGDRRVVCEHRPEEKRILYTNGDGFSRARHTVRAKNFPYWCGCGEYANEKICVWFAHTLVKYPIVVFAVAHSKLIMRCASYFADEKAIYRRHSKSRLEHAYRNSQKTLGHNTFQGLFDVCSVGIVASASLRSSLVQLLHRLSELKSKILKIE